MPRDRRKPWTESFAFDAFIATLVGLPFGQGTDLRPYLWVFFSKHPTKQRRNQATQKPSNQATKQPSNQATKQPSNQATKQPSNQATAQSEMPKTSAFLQAPNFGLRFPRNVLWMAFQLQLQGSQAANDLGISQWMEAAARGLLPIDCFLGGWTPSWVDLCHLGPPARRPFSPFLGGGFSY